MKLEKISSISLYSCIGVGVVCFLLFFLIDYSNMDFDGVHVSPALTDLILILMYALFFVTAGLTIWSLVRGATINSGNSGYTSLNLVDPAQYDWQVRRFQPQVVMVLIGGNDIVHPECGGVEGFRARLAELVRRIREDGAIPVLQTYNTMQLVSEIPQYVQRYNEFPVYCQTIREVASKEETILADHRRHWEENAADPATLASWLGEPLHPGARGHWEMAMILLKALGLYDENAACCQRPNLL